MVSIYLYAQPGTSGSYDLSIKQLLRAVFASLQKRHWERALAQIIGISQVFGGLFGQVRWPIPTAVSVGTQTQAYCTNGATGILYCAWDNSGKTPLSHFLWNAPSIQTGTHQGIAACHIVWNTRG